MSFFLFCSIKERSSFSLLAITAHSHSIHDSILHIFQGPRAAPGDLERSVYAPAHDARGIPGRLQIFHGSWGARLEQRTAESDLHQIQPGRTDPEIHPEMEGQGGGGTKVIAVLLGTFENSFQQKHIRQLKIIV